MTDVQATLFQIHVASLYAIQHAAFILFVCRSGGGGGNGVGWVDILCNQENIEKYSKKKRRYAKQSSAADKKT